MSTRVSARPHVLASLPVPPSTRAQAATATPTGPNLFSTPAPRKGPSLTGHTASVHVATNPSRTPAEKAGRRISDQVMNVLGSYGRPFLLDTDGLRAHVTRVATAFMKEADGATRPGSAYAQLLSKFPGATVSLVGTASLGANDQVYYLVKSRDGQVHKFENQSGGLVETPRASGEIFMAADLAPGKQIAVRVPDVRFLMDPTLAPEIGVGRTVDVVMDTPIDAQKRNATDTLVDQGDGVKKEVLPGTAKGEDGSPLGLALSSQRNEKGVILKYNGDKTYDVEVTAPDGTKQTVKRTEAQLSAENAPGNFDLHGSTFYDVSIDVDTDPSLQKFLDQAKAIAQKDIPADGSPEQKAAAQKQALVDLTILCNQTLSYPDESPTTTDEHSKKAMALMNAASNWQPMKLGDLIDAGRGVCRHQAILMQLACQEAGITSRPVTAAANDRQGNLRGYHAFLETTLDDGTQYLTDPTWFDAGPKNVAGYNFGPTVNGQQQVGTALWDTLYTNVLRQELPTWTANTPSLDASQVKFRENDDPVIDAQGKVTASTTVTPPAPSPTGTIRPAADVLADVSQALTGQPWSQYKNSVAGYTPDQLKGYGDYYVQQNNAAYAAYFYSVALDAGATGPLAKQCWQALGNELGLIAPDRTDLAALASDAKALGAQ